MYLGGVEIPNGNPLKLGGVQVDKIMLGNEQVWINHFAPSAITDFVASSSGTNSAVAVTFSNATGLPLPTYNLYQNDTLVQSNIASGYVYTSVVSGNNTYRVEAVNTVATVASNNDTANVWTGGSSLNITSSRSVTVGTHIPANAPITIQVMSAGGRGGTAAFSAGGLGGGASALVTKTATYASGTITATVGANNGATSTFDGLTTAGGTNRGQGGGATGLNHGASSAWGAGGKGGSYIYDSGKTAGGVGAGGGGTGGGNTSAGANGGRGEIRLSW